MYLGGAIMSTIGNRIKLKRKELGLTQAELGEKLNITDRAVSKWEQGEGDPNLSIIPDIAKILGVSLDYLLLGKEEEPAITLDDMDSEKRMHYLIKKDDIEGFLKYGYDGCSINNSLFKSTIRSFTTINLNIWKEILAEKANKILNKAFDMLLSKNNFCTSISFLVEDIIDDLIVKAVDFDRGDVLEAFGIMATKVGNKDMKEEDRLDEERRIANRKTFGLPLPLFGNIDDTFRFKPVIIKQETLDYIFENEKKAPKCYATVSKIRFKDVGKDERNYDRELYFYNVLENDVLNCAFRFGKIDLIKAYVTAFADELNDLEISHSYQYIVRETYIINNNRVVKRFYSWSKNYIDMMIAANETEIAKMMIMHNKNYANKYRRIYPNKKDEIYILTEDEIERKAKLGNANISDSERFMLEVIKDCCIDVGVLKTCSNINLVKKILSTNAINHYEFIYNCLKNKDLKSLFKFFIDHDDKSNAVSLMSGEKYYKEIMISSLERYCSVELCFDILGNKIVNDLRRNYNKRIEDEAFRRVSELLRKSDVLNNNPIIVKITELKEKILSDVEETIAAEKKAEEERIEREKVTKGLSRDYFEKLLNDNNREMFYLKLCSLLDAILKFDYHYEGEDLSARMKAHFIALEKAEPTLRDYDDGWGYTVIDTKYEKEVVEPTKKRIEHLRDIFYRLRVLRNNVAHSEQVKVNELSPAEMKECLEYVFSINKEAE